MDDVWLEEEERSKLYRGQRNGDVSRLSVIGVQEGPAKNITPMETPDGHLGPFYRVPVSAMDGTKQEMVLSPFFQAGHWHRTETDKSRRNEALYSYAIWISAANGEV